MAVLLNVQDLTHAFAHRPLYRDLNFSIENGEKCGLIGPNGAGKSSLLRILTGELLPDSGEITCARGTRIGYLEQTPEINEEFTIFQAILAKSKDPDEWEVQARAHQLISLFELDQFGEEITISQLSGGWRKRVALAREALNEPDLLLLDEPTNHLDIESILWLEDWIRSSKFATLTISHDRAFLDRVSNRILEVNRVYKDGIFSKVGNLEEFLASKQLLIDGQIRQETTMKNTLRRETEWLRQGAKARTTKQQARIQRAEVLKNEVAELTTRNQNRESKLEFQDSDKLSKKLIEAKKVTLRYGSKTLFQDLSILIRSGSRIGILGRNGAGKSSLIKVLLKKEEPTSGEIYHSENLEPVYYDQKREALNGSLTLTKTLCPLGEYVDFQGRKMHIRSYLDRFLFTQEQMELTVDRLSGGEQSRILLGRLMLQPANLLVLDEPTNDLDFQTLSLLEECIDDFSGAVIVVSHDRAFLESTCDQFIAFSPTRAGVYQIFSSLEQWKVWFDQERKSGGKRIEAPLETPKNAPLSAPTPAAPPTSAKGKKVSFKERHEWESMESTIHAAEAKVEKLTRESEDPKNLSNAVECARIMKDLSGAQLELERLYARWAELGTLIQGT
jgi:ABC transport system ATP-binding/permease protein